MAALAAGCSEVPAVSLAAGPGSPATQDAAAALFAAGTIASLSPLLAGRPSRPIDVGRERIFITNPYALATAELASLRRDRRAGEARPGRPSWPARPAWPGPAILPGRPGLPGGGPDDPAGPATGRSPPAETQRRSRASARGSAASPRSCGRPGPAVLPVDEEPWQLHATTRQPFGRMAAEVFEDDPGRHRGAGRHRRPGRSRRRCHPGDRGPGGGGGRDAGRDHPRRRAGRILREPARRASLAGHHPDPDREQHGRAARRAAVRGRRGRPVPGTGAGHQGRAARTGHGGRPGPLRPARPGARPPARSRGPLSARPTSS